MTVMVMDRERIISLLKEMSDYFKECRTNASLGSKAENHFWELQIAAQDAATLLKEQEWHLLTEDADGFIHGLPVDDGQYLMTDGKEIWIDDYVDGVDDGVWLDSGRDVREIKAWMYMPDLSKQEGR